VKIPHDAWILVGDGKKALILRNQGDQVHPNLVLERRFDQENPPTHEQGSDRPGRTNDAFGNRSAYENADWHQLEESRFAKELADELYRSAHQGAFDKLIVVAPPRVLGILREKFHPEVRERILGELDKTLTQHPVPDIERILGAEEAG
jgi:protein required for attachment to host cells